MFLGDDSSDTLSQGDRKRGVEGGRKGGEVRKEEGGQESKIPVSIIN